MSAERKIVLEHILAPGDVTCTTPLVRDIKATYGAKYAIDFRTNFNAIYECNPHLTPLNVNDADVEKIVLCYKDGIKSAENRGNKHHFLTWFYKDFEKKTGIPVDCLKSQTDLHLSSHEKAHAPIAGRYWLVFGGGKTDFTTKHWRFNWYQEVVDRLRSYGLRFAQSGASKPGNVHPPLRNVMNLVGWGWVRHLIWQIYHCEGIICPITAAAHMGSAFNKPVVVIAGGREHWHWEAYTNDGQFGPQAEPIKVPHRYLHTIGLLDCCHTRGCWKNKVVKISKDRSVCIQLAPGHPGGQQLPLCMHMITPDLVCEAALSYYADRTLPPIGLPQWQVREWYQQHAPHLAPPNIESCPINWDKGWTQQQLQAVA